MTEFYNSLLNGEHETALLATQVAKVAVEGDIIALSGDLGAGKSTFARAFIRARMKDETQEVPSPTFTLVQSYDPDEGPSLLHADLYRLSNPDDIEDLGLYDELDHSIMLIEWPDRMPDDWWRFALQVSLSLAEACETESRSVSVSSVEESWRARLAKVLK
ncbi:tRNA (adenosine(37)-N6)-threonylcarbamoyltransferase complex ATPase subunit type 1 TsaE [Kordiimonas aquimaris]|uniref:tRNA (adenosine(37)-N6)-threonylcarbamoyltransferase complex ATPase subunit type 1 TsaE n=1 Tax=Kordiimonas aquimaris TaxID=707591 RepID=UPI0021D35B37|nr:tRNA (adenosine(37)-N6)-threonylcarbamoyltransferase complex ATPase subunit type 1 TsaE [Kordiimonas aquimaris]